MKTLVKALKEFLKHAIAFAFFFTIFVGLSANFYGGEINSVVPYLSSAVLALVVSILVVRHQNAYWADINRPRSEYHRSDYRK